ncbi:immunoglobulin superfamily member 11-like isoform X1 [Sander lucioperca]|uniref:immunoglobulin superfamily member 11-like isoform X1 n=1 Tax=Sander lucioperca TaxID=283035 RepID=UPI00165375D2|nr:immunoglobulin superfamily member 11-like isoform X1 [Sander lucioperca]
MNILLDLLCLCLLCLTGKTLCDENGPKNIKVEGGTDVMLPCSLSTKENIESKLFDWRKVAQKDDGQKKVFLYDGGSHYNNGLDGQSEEFKGRVSHFQDELKHGNASIIIRNTKISDSGEYTCYFPCHRPPQIFYIELVVEPKVIIVKEDSDVVLPCSLSTKENITSKQFDWKKVAQKDDCQKEVFYYNGGSNNNKNCFPGQVSHFPDELKHGNASIIIRNTKVSDSGVYTCDFPKLQPPQTFHIELVVVEPKVITVEEGSDVTLPCSLWTKKDIRLTVFFWLKVSQTTDDLKTVFLYDNGDLYSDERPGQSEQFKGRVSHFPDELKQGNASIIIRNMTRADSGVYRCYFPFIKKHREFYIKLVVASAQGKELHPLI